MPSLFSTWARTRLLEGPAARRASPYCEEAVVDVVGHNRAVPSPLLTLLQSRHKFCWCRSVIAKPPAAAKSRCPSQPHTDAPSLGDYAQISKTPQSTARVPGTISGPGTTTRRGRIVAYSPADRRRAGRPLPCSRASLSLCFAGGTSCDPTALDSISRQPAAHHHTARLRACAIHQRDCSPLQGFLDPHFSCDSCRSPPDSAPVTSTATLARAALTSPSRRPVQQVWNVARES